MLMFYMKKKHFIKIQHISISKLFLLIQVPNTFLVYTFCANGLTGWISKVG